MSFNQSMYVQKFAECGNPYEAAVFAGAKRGFEAAAEGVRQMFSATVRTAAERLREKQAVCPAEQGLRRLAFGRINDAARLAFAEDITPEMLENADLSNVQEIKIGKGTVEIKFVDRLKALDMLGSLERENDSKFDLISQIYGTSGNE